MRCLTIGSWLVIAAVSAPGAGAAQSAAPPARALSLDEALQLARPASEAVAIARVGISRARADKIRAKSEMYPQITGSASYARQIKSQFQTASVAPDTTTGPPAPSSCPAFGGDPTRPIEERLAALETAVECTTIVNPFAAFSSLPFGRKNNYTLGLAGSQTLYDGGRIFGQIKAAEAGQRTAAIALTAAEAQVLLDVTQAYSDAALGDRLLAIGEATLAQSDTTLAQTKLRREVGTVPEFDLLRAQVARDNQRPIVITRRTQRDLAYVRLKQLLNLPLEQELTLTSELLTDTTLSRVPTLAQAVAATPDTAAEHRSAVRAATEAIHAQEGFESAARAGRMPSVVLSSQFSRFAYPSKGLPGWNDFLSDWRVSLGLTVPLFTGGRLGGERLAAKANLDEAKIRRTQITKAAALDTRNALAELEGAEASWRASEGTSTQAARAYQIADLRFREGISTQTELLDARIALQQAEVNRAQAARDLQIARVRIALIADLPLPNSPIASPQAGAIVTVVRAAQQTQAATGGNPTP
ncbi:MAG: TolC family protein [Gemmatimonadota bacterium]